MNKYEILLINPGKNPHNEAIEGNIKRKGYMYPYSLLYLQNFLIKHHISSKIIDLYWQPVNHIFDFLNTSSNPIIGVTAQAHSVNEAISIIKEIKKEKPSSFIVVGGNHFGYSAIDTLENIQEIDVVVRGEGEETFYELVNAKINSFDFDSINGISFRKNSEIIENIDRRVSKDLEHYSLDYENLPIEDRFSEGILIRNFEKEDYRSFPIFLGRGCSQKCVFCVYNHFKYRLRTKENIFNEMRYLIKKYDAKYFTFADPSFCERKEFIKDFCTSLINEFPEIKWSCEARVDTPIEILDLMAKAGCISIDFALESGSEKVLKSIRKNIDVNKTLTFAKKCKELNIRTHMFVMLSIPDETEEDAILTTKTVKQLSQFISSMSLAITQIHPGTELERIAKDRNILPENFSYYKPEFYHNHSTYCDEHIPLYIEHLSIEFISKQFNEMMDIKAAKVDNLNVVLRKAFLGIKNIHTRPLKTNIKYAKRFIFAFYSKVLSLFKK